MTSDTSRQDGARARLMVLFSIVAASALPIGCGGGDDAPAPAPAPAPTPAPQPLTCDDTMKTEFTTDAHTPVLLVKSFKTGDPLPVGHAGPDDPGRDPDVCVVKVLVGPGNPGPAGAPSTSPGIGIEVWLPRRPSGTSAST